MYLGMRDGRSTPGEPSANKHWGSPRAPRLCWEACAAVQIDGVHALAGGRLSICLSGSVSVCLGLSLSAASALETVVCPVCRWNAPPPPLSHVLAMGNQPSRTPTPGGSSSSSHPQSPVAGVTSPTSHGPHHVRDRLQHPHVQQHNPRRRESIQALSTVFERKASVAPPSASLESVAADLTAPARPRSRSQTVSTVSAANSTTAHVANTLRAAQDTFKSASHDRMGNDQSRPRGHHPRDLTPPKPKPVPVPVPATTDDKPAASPRPVSKPLPLPIPRDQPHSHGSARVEPLHPASLEPADASQDAFVVPSSHYSRPPRLPLPIEEEPVGPGSPIIPPADLNNFISHDEVEGALPRRASMLSDRTADADDDDLADEFKGPQGQVTVPTLIEWDGPGERVFVTGTFAGWERKFKLHAK